MQDKMYTPPKRKVNIFKKDVDKYNTFDDTKLNYFEPINFRKANSDYLTIKDHLYASWEYGDTFNLKFDLTQFDDYLDYRKIPVTASNIEVRFYNFRYEEIYKVDCEPNDIINILIDEDTSNDLFKRGNYFCEVKLFIYMNNINSVSTLIPAELCMLNVR